MSKIMTRISISLLQKRRYMDKIFYKRSIFEFKLIDMEVVSSLSHCLIRMMEFQLMKKESVEYYNNIMNSHNSC
jgi:hypothetical protein